MWLVLLVFTAGLDGGHPGDASVDGSALTADAGAPDGGVNDADAGGEEVVLSNEPTLVEVIAQERAEEAAADGGESDAGAPDGGSPAQLALEAPASEDVPAHEGEEVSGVRVHLRLGFVAEWGSHPGAPLGLSLGGRFGGAHWSAVLEAWGLLPNSIGDSLDRGSLSVGSFGGAVGVCYEHPLLSGVLMGCALGRGGVMRFEPHNLSDLQAAWQPLVSGGLRVGGEWPRDSFLAFYTTLEAYVPIVRGSLTGATVGWSQFWVFGGAQVGFRVRIQ